MSDNGLDLDLELEAEDYEESGPMTPMDLACQGSSCGGACMLPACFMKPRP
ncbi:hypothetical protein [Streptomyces sedi]|uniref:hypothetical protein n=1 Tax=Streptomyces sedi TaxID=555059 RepID=UPI0014769899|nr:hypothetical protein [Streptomyces sedi]